MSISSIVFANKLNMYDSNEHILGGVYTYLKAGGGGYYVFDGAFQVQVGFGLTNEYKLVRVAYLNNGLIYQLRYKLTDSNNTYIFEIQPVLTDKDDNIVKLWSGMTLNYLYDPNHSYRPLDECYATIAHTTYQPQTPPVAGDPAAQVSFPGYIYRKKPAVLMPIPLSGSVEFDDLFSTWDTIPITNFVSDDTDFTNFKNDIITKGNGKDPFTSNEPDPEPDPSEPGGGDIPSTDGGDAIDFPGLPTTSVIASGLITAYNPDNTKLRSLATVLWGNDFENTIKKILNDPFDGIIGLALFPFAPTTSGNKNCIIGNFDTEISMPLVSSQYITIDAGSVTVPESWRNALDYSPNTTVEIFIPFVGFRTLKTEDVMRSTIALKYNVDLLSGAALAMVKCGDKVMYTYPCKLSYDVPLTGSNKAALYTGMVNIAMSAIKGASMGGALGAAGGAATSAIQTATSKQSNIDRSGAVTSNTGDLGDFVPYIVIHRPVQSMPAQFKQIKGYQSNITSALSELSGYTEVDYIHLTGISGATDTELNEIEQLLKNGVII